MGWAVSQCFLFLRLWCRGWSRPRCWWQHSLTQLPEHLTAQIFSHWPPAPPRASLVSTLGWRTTYSVHISSMTLKHLYRNTESDSESKWRKAPLTSFLPKFLASIPPPRNVQYTFLALPLHWWMWCCDATSNMSWFLLSASHPTSEHNHNHT